MPDAAPGEALEAIMAFETSAQAFFDWLFFDVSANDGRTIADAFLQARGWTISPPATDYLRLMIPTHLGLYQVRRVEPGTGLALRDLWTKEDLFITERRGSSQLVKWDVLAARVVAHGDGMHQLEGSVMALPPYASGPLLKDLKAEFRAFSRRHADAPLAEFFKQAAPLMHDAWMNEVALREPPALQTLEGDPITESTMVFDVPGAGDAFARVLLQPDFEAGTIGRAAWCEGEGERKRVLGDLEVKKGALTLHTFSRQRAARGRARLEAILGPLSVRSETQLDGLTPRQASRNKRLRPALRELLIHVENQAARINKKSPRDFDWMWKELRLRRS